MDGLKSLNEIWNEKILEYAAARRYDWRDDTAFIFYSVRDNKAIGVMARRIYNGNYRKYGGVIELSANVSDYRPIRLRTKNSDPEEVDETLRQSEATKKEEKKRAAKEAASSSTYVLVQPKFTRPQPQKNRAYSPGSRVSCGHGPRNSLGCTVTVRRLTDGEAFTRKLISSQAAIREKQA